MGLGVVPHIWLSPLISGVLPHTWLCFFTSGCALSHLGVIPSHLGVLPQIWPCPSLFGMLHHIRGCFLKSEYSLHTCMCFLISRYASSLLSVQPHIWVCSPTSGCVSSHLCICFTFFLTERLPLCMILGGLELGVQISL